MGGKLQAEGVLVGGELVCEYELQAPCIYFPNVG
jgi:hypothetical protein